MFGTPTPVSLLISPSSVGFVTWLYALMNLTNSSYEDRGSLNLSSGMYLLSPFLFINRRTASGMSRRRLGAEIAYAIFRANRPSGAKSEGGRLDSYCSSRCAASTIGSIIPLAVRAAPAARTLCVSGAVFRVRSTQLLGSISAPLLGRMLHHGLEEPVHNCMPHIRTPRVDHLWILERGQ